MPGKSSRTGASCDGDGGVALLGEDLGVHVPHGAAPGPRRTVSTKTPWGTFLPCIVWWPWSGRRSRRSSSAARAEVFGTRRAGVPHALRVRRLRRDARPGADDGRVRRCPCRAGLVGARRRGHRAHPGLGAARRAAARPRCAARCCRAHAPRRAARHHLLGRVRARPHRAAGRPVGRHALGRRSAAAGPSFPTCAWTPTGSTSTTATSPPAPVRRPASTCACTWCAGPRRRVRLRSIARHMVMPPHREGGQAQYAPTCPPPDRSPLAGPAAGVGWRAARDAADGRATWPRT